MAQLKKKKKKAIKKDQHDQKRRAQFATFYSSDYFSGYAYF